MSQTPLPPGWTIERYGLIDSLEFRSPNGLTLMWHDGRWTTWRGTVCAPAPGVPAAGKRADAERIGREFIAAYEAVEDSDCCAGTCGDDDDWGPHPDDDEPLDRSERNPPLTVELPAGDVT